MLNRMILVIIRSAIPNLPIAKPMTTNSASTWKVPLYQLLLMYVSVPDPLQILLMTRLDRQRLAPGFISYPALAVAPRSGSAA